jgi:hypothetical protein
LCCSAAPSSSFLPSFAFSPDSKSEADLNSIYNNGIVFEANTVWSDPFTESHGIKLIRTINGSPNDAMEGAFNAYLSQYLQMYAVPLTGTPLTLDAVLWAGEFQSWHDYFAALRLRAPIEGPAGLTVLRTSPTNNLVSWYAVYGATSYTLQRKLLALGGNWTTVSGCVAGATGCTDTATTGSQYAYPVQASNGTKTSTWSNVAVFLSESAYDGYVKLSGTTYTAVPNMMTQPRIRAGELQGTPAYSYERLCFFQYRGAGFHDKSS